MECKICGNDQDNVEYEAREMMFGIRDNHLYFQCAQCKCLQINSVPKNMDRYYDSSIYYSYKASKAKSALYRLLIRLRNRYALFGKGLIGRVLNSKQPAPQFRFMEPLRENLDRNTKILDVGCGAGNLIRLLHGAGFEHVLGADPFIEDDITHEDGVTIKRQYIHDVQGNYDLIMLHHAFEHVPDPIDTLQSAFDLLVPGGYCVIRIPVVSSYAWEHYNVNWVQLDAPRHFFIHSTESMDVLSRKIGFKQLNTIYDSTAFQFWGSEQYVKDIPLHDERSYKIRPSNSIFSEKDIASFERRAKELNTANQGDQAIFYLQKP